MNCKLQEALSRDVECHDILSICPRRALAAGRNRRLNEIEFKSFKVQTRYVQYLKILMLTILTLY